MEKEKILYGYKNKYCVLTNNDAIKVVGDECIIDVNFLLNDFLDKEVSNSREAFAYNQFMMEFITKLQRKGIKYRFIGTKVDKDIHTKLALEFREYIFDNQEKILYKSDTRNSYSVRYGTFDFLGRSGFLNVRANPIICRFSKFGFDPVYGTVHCPVHVERYASEVKLSSSGEEGIGWVSNADSGKKEMGYYTVVPPVPSLPLLGNNRGINVTGLDSIDGDWCKGYVNQIKRFLRYK